ncbi:hypothetical protein FGSG_04645 [Fusarium graminearum PH-1]|uniref:hypothetical protein n=1 Tax=Gibberella zeae (strain ATCC MYA-4620 / CBS 123657 / FGSC 9075 / NRRL 31084 / PH-1) TaxID=229533 RepID=UPI00021F16DA|nr:hypothetical protein FGSG_04645 [Fusarium graminearum PH-1]ESU08428.1 hypothetical protein FGSG_04645 [Fusarium graminearum PH-1]|eukprot:XP_011320927.1 hypothetical protein FGSG_04645 [Fusarium graminearum PH-1]
MKEKALLYPASTKEVECLTHSPPVLDNHKLDPDDSKSSQESPNTSSETAEYWEKKRLTVVAILYGLDLKQSTKSNARAHPSWVYAEVVAALSMISCIMQWIFMTAVWYWCFLDALISVLWLAQFGVFASIYLDAEAEQTFAPASVDRMQAAVWINLVCVVLWFVATLYGAIGCCARFKRVRQMRKDIRIGLKV